MTCTHKTHHRLEGHKYLFIENPCHAYVLYVSTVYVSDLVQLNILMFLKQRGWILVDHISALAVLVQSLVLFYGMKICKYHI